MADQTSAGVYITEEDRSQYAKAASTSIGVVVGASKSGEVMKRVLVTSKDQFLSMFGQPDPSVSYMHNCALAFLKESGKLYVTRVCESDTLTGGAYFSVDDVKATIPRLNLSNFDDGVITGNPKGKWDPFNTEQFLPTTPGIENILGFFCAIDPGKWNNDLFIRVKPSTKRGMTTPDDPLLFIVEVFLKYASSSQRPLESYTVRQGLGLDGFGKQQNIEQQINIKSNLVRYRANPYAASNIKVLTTADVFIKGATDGSRPTESSIIKGWELYTDQELVKINILINAGYTSVAVFQSMLQIAEHRTDCMAVLDTPSDVQQVADAMQFINNDLNYSSNKGAIYSPDLLVYDEYSDREYYVPPSGLVAAAYAYTDRVKATWFDPAGMVRGDLSVLGVKQVYNQDDRDLLDSVRINPIRVFNMQGTSGYKIWSASTLQWQSSALSNVNVRRLMNLLETSISEASLFSVFEPNDEDLWNSLIAICNSFLKPIKAGRGLYWFGVQCDHDNNTPESIAVEDVHLAVFIDPTIAAKRILLNAIVTRTGATFTFSTNATP